MSKRRKQILPFSSQMTEMLRLAKTISGERGEDVITAESLLHAMAREPDEQLRLLFDLYHVPLERMIEGILFVIGTGTPNPEVATDTLSPRATDAMEKANSEARRMRSRELLPIHILYGIVDEGETIASGLLESFGISEIRLLRARIKEVCHGTNS